MSAFRRRQSRYFKVGSDLVDAYYFKIGFINIGDYMDHKSSHKSRNHEKPSSRI